jgi:hypothetical protein
MSAAMSARKQRQAQRAAHLVAAGLLLAYVYAPLDAELEDVVRFVVFPALVLTGVAMWQSGRIRRALRARRHASSQPRTERPSRGRKDVAT